MDEQRRAALAAATFGALAAGAALLTAGPAEAFEHHPAIRRAIGALEAARADLQRANHDFGGHRVAAMDAIDRALEQLRLALQFDR